MRRPYSRPLGWLSVAVVASLIVVAALQTAVPSGAQVILDPPEQAALNALNAERTSRGLVALKVSPDLQAAAEWMAADLADRDLLDHTDSLGRAFDERFADFGYEHPGTVRENLAAGQRTGEDVVEAWMNSSGHRVNNLSEESRVAGIALVEDPSSTYRYFWALGFGSFDDSGSAPPPVATPNPEAGAATPASIVGTVPTQQGFGLLVTGEDATGPELLAGLDAHGCNAISVWVIMANRMVGYIGAAPGFVSAAFPPTVNAGTPFIAVCG